MALFYYSVDWIYDHENVTSQGIVAEENLASAMGILEREVFDGDYISSVTIKYINDSTDISYTSLEDLQEFFEQEKIELKGD